jgi:type III secretion protein W
MQNLDLGKFLNSGLGSIATEAFSKLETADKTDKSIALGKQTEAQEDQSLALRNYTGPIDQRIRTQREKDKPSLREKVKETMGKAEEGAKIPSVLRLKKDSEGSAKRFQEQTADKDFTSDKLLKLATQIKAGSTPEEILEKTLDMFSDPFLADEALRFLLENADPELQSGYIEKLKLARQRLNEDKKMSDRIKAGKTLRNAAFEAQKQKLGTASDLHALYKELANNPRDLPTLFDDLSNKYNYKELLKITNFLLSTFGKDLKSEGTNIEKGYLSNLLKEIKVLQAVVGIYRFFRSKVQLTKKLFVQQHTELPQILTFEQMSKSFMNIARDRYPTPDKVLSIAFKLGVEKSIPAQIVVLERFRDAIYEVSPGQVYNSPQHKDDVLKAIIEALEQLEIKLEEIEEKIG